MDRKEGLSQVSEIPRKWIGKGTSASLYDSWAEDEVVSVGLGKKCLKNSVSLFICGGGVQVPGSLEKYLGLMDKVEGSPLNVCCVAVVLKFLATTKNKALIDQKKVMGPSVVYDTICC